MALKFKATVDHSIIRNWIEAHKGKPAVIDGKRGLRIDFPGNFDEVFLSEARSTDDVSWDVFFKVFEENNLAFMYMIEGNDTDPTVTYRFINRDNLMVEESSSHPK